MFTLTQLFSMETPREKLLLLFSGEWVARGLYVATKLEVADHLTGGPKSVAELALVTKANPEALERLLHMLSGFGIFEETSPGVFGNSEASLLLTKSSPDSLHALSLWYGEDIHKSWEEFLQTVQTNKPSFELVYHQPPFKYLKENPARAAIFQEAMKEKSKAVIQSALEAYDFSAFNSIYDIGGGYGQFMHALTNRYPKLQGVLFELPAVVEVVKKQTPNFQLEAGDFFETIPSGGNAYILKSVLHDWDDAKAEKILQVCHTAMAPGSKLLIVEVVLQPKDQSLYANCMDLLMLAVTGGKERSLDAFKQMLDRSGFTLENIYPTATEFSILEARKK